MDTEIDYDRPRRDEIEHYRPWTDEIDYDRKRRADIVLYVMEGSLSVVGALLSLWFLAAIFTSVDMRSRLRNKVICNTCVVNLMERVVIISWIVSEQTSKDEMRSSLGNVYYNLVCIMDWIANWLVVMLVAVFIAQIQDVNPPTRLTPRATTLCTVGLMLLPWVTSFIFVPSVFFGLGVVEYGRLTPTYFSLAIIKSVDTVVPIVLAILLVITATALRHRRTLQGPKQAELITRRPEVDTMFVYVAAVVVSAVCELPRVFESFRNWFGPPSEFTQARQELLYALTILSDARVVLMPLAWLLLPDIRQRLKTWRPWRCSTPDIVTCDIQEGGQ